VSLQQADSFVQQGLELSESFTVQLVSQQSAFFASQQVEPPQVSFGWSAA
jgi:hypothetical protein